MLCVPKMQIALVPIQRKIKFNVVDTFSQVRFFLGCFGFLHHWHCKTTPLHLHPVLHPITFCYIRSAVVLLWLPAYAFSLFNILRLSTIPISYSILAKDITFLIVQRHEFALHIDLDTFTLLPAFSS